MKDSSPVYSGISYDVQQEGKLVRRVFHQSHLMEDVIALEHSISHENEHVLLRGDPDPGSNALLYNVEDKQRLDQLMLSRSLPENHKFDLTHRILDVLQLFADRNIVLKDLHPKLFYYDPKSTQITFTGCAEKQDEGNELPLEIDFLAYISPEQTARTEQGMDIRSNFYTLGVILYQLFTDILPFRSNDALKMIHMHLAKEPVEPFNIMAHPLKAISQVILRLLEKNPYNRYQSLQGIRYDIKLAQENFNQDLLDITIELGTQDVASKLDHPDNMLHRAHETEQIRKILKEVDQHRKSYLEIRGPEGFGKTSILESIEKEFTDDAIHIIWTNTALPPLVPYSIVVQLTNKLIEIWEQMEPEAKQEIKDRAVHKLGLLSNLLLDLNPTLSVMLESTEDNTVVEGLEAQNRFNAAVSNFLKLFSDVTIALVIENINRSDLSILALQEFLFADSDLNNIVIIGTVEDEELGDRFNSFTENLSQRSRESERFQYEHIVLKPILLGTIREIFIDYGSELADKLAQLLVKKTGGNPYFLQKAISQIKTDRILDRDQQSGKWHINWSKAATIHSSETVVDHLGLRINQYPESIATILAIAACAGHEFGAELLMEVSSETPAVIKASLERLTSDGYFDRLHSPRSMGEYQFAHPRLIEASLRKVTTAERRRYKHGILKYYLSRLDQTQKEQLLFELAEYALDIEPADQTGFGSLLQDAAEKAYRQAAFEKSHEYYRCLFTTKAQESEDREELFQLYRMYANAAVNAYRFEEFKSIISQMEKHVSGLHDRIELYILWVIYYNTGGQLLKAVETAVKALKECSIRISINPTLFRIIWCTIKLKIITRNLTEERAINMQLSQDPVTLSYTKLIVLSLSAVYQTVPKLIVPLTEILVRNTVRLGLYPSSPNALAMYGFIQTSFTNDIPRGFEYGRMGMKIAEKFNNPQLQAHTNFTFYSFIHHFRNPLSETAECLHREWRIALELGNINLAFYDLGLSQWCTFFAGRPFAELKDRLLKDVQFCEDFKQTMVAQYHRIILQFAENLESRIDGNYLKGTHLDYSRIEESLLEKNDVVTLANLKYMRVIVGFLYGDYSFGLQDGDAVIKLYQSTGFSTPNSVVAVFYIFMSWLASKNATRKQLKTIKSFTSRFRKWAKNAPSNYAAKNYLLKARLAEYRKDTANAGRMYQYAYENASRYGNVWDLAVVTEEYGRFAATTHDVTTANQYISQAMKWYHKWGATGKFELLRQQYPEIEFVAYEQSKAPSISSKLDLDSLLKASTAISSQIHLDKLVAQILGIVIENAGAQKGVFIRAENGNLKVYGERRGTDFIFKNGEAVTDSNLPEELIRYVSDKQKPVVLADIKKDNVFGNSEYVLNNPVASVLCVPIVKNQKLLGIIYLENYLAPGFFTAKRVDMVEMLSSQMAVSIENSLLYENLEEKVQERTAELDAEKSKSDELLKNILPDDVARELKEQGHSKARHYDHVTVMFTDFKGFTEVSRNLSAVALVAEIDSCFSEFDKIIDKHNIEKIKTIGDSYMCAGGIPEGHEDSVFHVVAAAIEIRDYMKKRNLKNLKENKPVLEIRIGIHTGPVVAGIVGTRKFAYDIWGDTVNTASRLESEGDAGKINISKEVQEIVNDKFVCQHRGAIAAKGKGMIDMYFVEPKP